MTAGRKRYLLRFEQLFQLRLLAGRLGYLGRGGGHSRSLRFVYEASVNFFKPEPRAKREQLAHIRLLRRQLILRRGLSLLRHDEDAAHEGRIASSLELAAPRLRDAFEVFVNILEPSELADEVERCLLPYARHAGNVVDGVTEQR